MPEKEETPAPLAIRKNDNLQLFAGVSSYKGRRKFQIAEKWKSADGTFLFSQKIVTIDASLLRALREYLNSNAEAIEAYLDKEPE